MIRTHQTHAHACSDRVLFRFFSSRTQPAHARPAWTVQLQLQRLQSCTSTRENPSAHTHTHARAHTHHLFLPVALLFGSNTVPMKHKCVAGAEVMLSWRFIEPAQTTDDTETANNKRVASAAESAHTARVIAAWCGTTPLSVVFPVQKPRPHPHSSI